MRLKLLAAMALAVLAMTAAACGGSDDSTSSGGTGEASTGATEASTETSGGSGQVDVGLDEPLELPSGNVKVGFFTAGTSNAWLNVLADTINEKASEYGWDQPSLYDSEFDPAKQLDQMQNAVQQGGLNAAIVLPDDGTLECKATTEQLPEAGIVPVILTVPVCGHEADTGEESWEPGILTFVGLQDNAPFNKAWIKAAAELNPGPQKVALFRGPDVGGQGIAIEAAVQEFEEENDEFEVAYQIETNYTTADGLAKARALLKANPDITVVMSAYSPDLTRGVLQALTEIGEAGKLPLIDVGATEWTYEQMEKGLIQMTTPLMPVNEAAATMEALKAAQEGKKVEKFIDPLPDDHPYTDPLIITKDNMSEYKPQY